jgi:hypothetical protein
MKIEKGDIFLLNDRVYLLVIRDPQDGFSDDYGDFPSTTECVPAVRSSYVVDDQADLESIGLVFRNWAEMGLDWVWIDTQAHNNIRTDALERLERVAQDRSDQADDDGVGTIRAIYAQIRCGLAGGISPDPRRPHDTRLRRDLQGARTVMRNMPNAMG